MKQRKRCTRKKKIILAKKVKKVMSQPIACGKILLAMVLFVFLASTVVFLPSEQVEKRWVEQEEALVSAAKSQIGTKGGEKYWRWCGFQNSVDWCACFISWCANEAGLIEEGLVPMFAECNEGILWFQKEGRWIDEADTLPSAGMLIFFDWQQDGSADHVGIVESCENGNIHTIEGNVEDECMERVYKTGSEEIMGYGEMLGR